MLDDAASQLAEIQRDLPGAALLVVDNPPDVCCRIGFDAVPLPSSEMPTAITFVGEANGLAVAVEQAILPEGGFRLMLGLDGETGLLMATLLSN